MPIQVSNIVLPAWADGDHVLYNDYVITISQGGVFQTSSRVFLFRNNLRTDIRDWLLNECAHEGELFTNIGGYLSCVYFETNTGAMEFKLRWL